MVSVPLTLGSRTTFNPLISWIRRKKSFRSTSFRLTEIGSPVYLGPATARGRCNLRLLLGGQILRRLVRVAAACGCMDALGVGKQIGFRPVRELSRGGNGARRGRDGGRRFFFRRVPRLGLIRRFDEHKVAGGGSGFRCRSRIAAAGSSPRRVAEATGSALMRSGNGRRNLAGASL